MSEQQGIQRFFGGCGCGFGGGGLIILLIMLYLNQILKML